MPKIAFQFEMERETNLGEAARQIEDRLKGLEDVAVAEARPSEQKLGLPEVVALVGGLVILAKTSGNLIEEVRKVIRQIEALAKDIKGLKGVFVEVGAQRKPISAVTDEDLRKLAGQSKTS